MTLSPEDLNRAVDDEDTAEFSVGDIESQLESETSDENVVAAKEAAERTKETFWKKAEKVYIDIVRILVESNNVIPENTKGEPMSLEEFVEKCCTVTGDKIEFNFGLYDTYINTIYQNRLLDLDDDERNQLHQIVAEVRRKGDEKRATGSYARVRQ